MLQEACTFFWNFLWVELTAVFLSIWTWEAIPSCWLRTRVSSTFLLSHCLNLTHHHPGHWNHPHWPLPWILYHNLQCFQRLLQPNHHWGWWQLWPDWRGDWQAQAPDVGAMAGYQLDGWVAAPTADATFLNASMSPLATLTFRCAVEGAVPFLVLETKGKCKRQVPNWSASGQNIWHGENWRWGAGLMCWAPHRHWNSGVLKFWSGVIHLGICPWLHDGSECFTHWVCKTSTRLGSGREIPRKKPHWIGLTHLREDLPEGGVYLLRYPGLLVLLFLNHPWSLVLIILGQPFQFEGQPPFKLSLGLGSFF